MRYFCLVHTVLCRTFDKSRQRVSRPVFGIAPQHSLCKHSICSQMKYPHHTGYIHRQERCQTADICQARKIRMRYFCLVHTVLCRTFDIEPQDDCQGLGTFPQSMKGSSLTCSQIQCQEYKTNINTLLPQREVELSLPHKRCTLAYCQGQTDQPHMSCRPQTQYRLDSGICRASTSGTK